MKSQNSCSLITDIKINNLSIKSKVCVTVFSAPNYCDQMGNKAAYIHLRGSDLWPQFHQFTAVPHPDVKPMAYASTLLQLGMM